MAPRGPGRGRGLGDAPSMDTAALARGEQQDGERGIDQQAIVDGVVFFLPALTRLLCSRVLGADDPPFGAVMGKSRYVE